MKKNEIKKLLEKDEEYLLKQIGWDILGKPSLEGDDEKIKKEAKSFLHLQKNNFKKAICNNSKVKLLMNSNESLERKIQLVTVVADLLSTYLIGIPAWNIAVLLVMIGLDSICPDMKSES